MRALGLSAVNRRGRSVEFRVDSGLLSNDDSYKGFYYGLVAPYPVKNSLDSYRRSEADKDQDGNWGVCKALKRNWYIYLFVNR
jgi:hypothetical protein